MSHLGERVSALMDGELGHAERERALAHLTGCADCRRSRRAPALKSRLRSLDPPSVPVDLTMSLLRMSEPGGPLPPRVRPIPTMSYTLPSAPVDNRPRRNAGLAGPGRAGRSRRAGYVAVGVASAAVALGTLFMVGGAESRPSAPPGREFANQHRATPAGQLVPGRGGLLLRSPDGRQAASGAVARPGIARRSASADRGRSADRAPSGRAVHAGAGIRSGWTRTGETYDVRMRSERESGVAHVDWPRE